MKNSMSYMLFFLTVCVTFVKAEKNSDNRRDIPAEN